MQIITSVLQVLLDRLEFRMGLTDAELAPRFDCRGETITAQAGIPASVCQEVRSWHPSERLPRSHGGLALVHAIAIPLRLTKGSPVLPMPEPTKWR